MALTVSSVLVKGEHWTHQLFLQRPELFMAVHLAGLKYAEAQVQRLEQILLTAGVPKRGRLLDAACGIGRHAIQFASRGWQAVGVELVPEYVEKARELAKVAGANSRIDLYVGDIREVGNLLKDEAPFDAILNLLTSLGYWDDATDVSILEQLHELAAPRGVLLLDTVNRDYVIKHFEPTSMEEYGDVVYAERRTLDLEASRIRSRWTFYEKHAEDLKHSLSVDVDHRVYSSHELKGVMEAGGWRDVRVYSGWDLKPLSSDIYRLMAMGRR